MQKGGMMQKEKIIEERDDAEGRTIQNGGMKQEEDIIEGKDDVERRPL